MITSPLYSHGPNHKFGQYPMSQNQLAVPSLAMAICSENPWVVIEIGTQQGGLVCALSELVSIDIQDQRPDEVKDAFKSLGIDFVLGDCFEEVPKILKQYSNQKVFLLCDGGNKQKEYETFKKIIKCGDIIAAHDWVFLLERYRPEDFTQFWNWSEYENDLKENFKDDHAHKMSSPWYFKPLAFAAWYCQKKSEN